MMRATDKTGGGDRRGRLVWVWLIFSFAAIMPAAHGQARGAVMESVGEQADVIGADQHGGMVFVATNNALWRRAADGTYTSFWKARVPGVLNHGPLVDDNRIFVVSDDALLMSPLGEAPAFKPVTVGGGRVWSLPRRVHDRWVIQTEEGARQSRDLLKWEPLFPADGIYAKHLAWLDGAWWALQDPPPEKPDPDYVVMDIEGEEEDWRPDSFRGMPAAPRVTLHLRRSTDLKQWTTVREVEVSLIDTGLFTFAGKLVAVGEAGLDILPTGPDEEVITADTSEGLAQAAVLGSRMWLSTGLGLLVSGENDPTHWTWMDGTEFNRELTGPVTGFSGTGRLLVIGNDQGRVALLRPEEQERVAAGGLAFAQVSTVGGLYAGVPSFAIRKLVRAGNSFYAIGEDDVLYHARLGEAWIRMPIFGKIRIQDIATDGKNTLLVSLSEEWKLDDGQVSHSHKTHTYVLYDTAKPHYRDIGFKQTPKVERLSLHYGGGRFVAWGFESVLTTTDGKDWETVTLPGDYLRPKAVHYVDGSYLVLLADDKGVLRTRDFKTWEPRIPALLGGYLESVYVTASDGRAIFQYSPRSVDSQNGKVYYEDKLSISTDGGATWTAVSGLSTSSATRLLGAFDEAGERHWLVFNDAVYASVGNALTEWRRISAFDARRFAPVEGTGTLAEIAAARGLVPFALNRDLLAGSSPVATRQVPANATDYLLAAFIDWDDAASAATDIAGLKTATQTFMRAITAGIDVEKAEDDRLRSLALRRLALFASLDDIVEVAGHSTFDAIKHTIAAGDRARVQRALYEKVRNANVRPSGSGTAIPAYERDYQSLAKNWKPRAIRFTPPEPESPELLGYGDRRIMQARAFRGEAGGIIDLFIGYSSGGFGLVSKHASVWWDTEAPDVRGKAKAGDEALDQFLAQQGSAWTKLNLVRQKFKASSGEKAPPLDDAALAELEEMFRLGVNYAAYWLAEEYNHRYRREAAATRSPMGRNAQLMRIWARRGAERGYAPSMVKLAQAYSYGIGGTGEEDPAAAVEWARRAVATGHPLAAKIFNPTELAIMENDIVMGGRSKRMTAEEAFDPAIMDSLVVAQVDLSKRIVEDRVWAIATKAIEAMPAGPDRDKARAELRAKQEERVRYRSLSEVLLAAAVLPDDEASGRQRTAALGAAALMARPLFGQIPRFMENTINFSMIGAFQDKNLPAERKAAILDAAIMEVPTLADLWAVRAALHFDAGEIELAKGKLDVARLINPQEQAVINAAKKIAPTPATNKAPANPAVDYALGLDYEEGRKGTAPSERKANAITAYRRASDADHVLATMALVRLLNEQRLELEEKGDSTNDQAVRRYEELVKEIQERILRAARLGNGEAMRIHALWIGQGQMGGDTQSNAVLALVKLEESAEAGDLIAMRLLIRAAQAGEWKPPATDTVEKFVEKLAAAGEADAKALLQQRDAQKSFEREFWGPRGTPVADPKAGTAAVPTEPTLVSGVPRPLLNHFQVSRPTTTTARSAEAARGLVIAMMSDGRIDAVERTILVEVTKPSFRLKLMQPADAQGAARELVFLGSYQSQARVYLERFIPVAGSERPEMTPLMQRYFWIWTGVNGWKQAIAHADASPAGRQEMLTVLQNWFSEKWPGSNVTNSYEPIRDELATFKNVLAQMKGREYEIGRSLVYEACQALDKSVNDAVPDFLYAEFKDAPAGK